MERGSWLFDFGLWIRAVVVDTKWKLLQQLLHEPEVINVNLKSLNHLFTLRLRFRFGWGGLSLVEVLSSLSVGHAKPAAPQRPYKLHARRGVSTPGLGRQARSS